MMPVYRRVNAQSAESSKKVEDAPATDDSPSQRLHRQKSHESSEHGVRKVKTLALWGLVLVQVVLLLGVAWNSRIKSNGHLAALLTTVWMATLPVFLILSVGLGVFDTYSKDLPHQRYIPLVVVATIVGNQLPSFLSSGMAAAGMLVFGLSSRPKNESKTVKNKESSLTKKSGLSGPIKAVLAVILMTTVLLTENFFIWVVSATYKKGQQVSNLPDPLQDNGQIILRHFLNEILDWTKRDIVKLRNMINVEWILVSGLGMSLVASEIQGTAMKRNLWGLALRGLLTLTIARAIRTISFLITVLPSQNPRCYFSHFPVPPPQDWSTWLMTGFIPQANGGCNDLIISGHATVTSTLACIVTSIVGKPLFTSALWTLVAVDYMVEIYEGFHYSVDMWLGAILVNFIWTVLAPMEEASVQEQQALPAKQFHSIGDATRADWIKFAIPVVAAYVQVIGALVPQEKANYTIVVFIIAVIYQISTSGFQQYTQHCLFSLLYLALGIYL
jgi:hypothetical protein